MNGGAGKKQTASLLNKTLEHIVSLLEKNNITNWFLGYGTLLGIVRNNSCIKNDDDIDIIINYKYKDVLRQIDKENKFKITKQKGNQFLRFEHDDYAPIDFYLSIFKDDTAMDKWEKTKWTNILPVIQKKWRGVVLQIPNHHISNLKNRYGSTWKTPRNYKGKHSKTLKKSLTYI